MQVGFARRSLIHTEMHALVHGNESQGENGVDAPRSIVLERIESNP